MTMDIRQVGEPVLRQRGRPLTVEEIRSAPIQRLIDGIADHRRFPRLRIDLAAVRERDVEYLLSVLAVLQPDLYDLHAIQIGAIRIFERPDGECGCACLRSSGG